jgi:hypothetical protein
VCNRAVQKLIGGLRKGRDAAFKATVRDKASVSFRHAGSLIPKYRTQREHAMAIPEIIGARLSVEGAVPECVVNMLTDTHRKNGNTQLWVEATPASCDYLTKATLYHSDFDEGNDDDPDDEQTPEGECESPEPHATGRQALEVNQVRVISNFIEI